MEHSNMEVVQGANSIINIISKKEEEVEDLIGLAEEVSTNIEKLYQNRSYLIISSFFSIIITVFAFIVLWNYVIDSKIGNSFNAAIQGLLWIIAAVAIFISVRRINTGFQIKKKIQLESNILGDLLNMIDGLKRNLSDDSLIRKAYFDMRLSRINFKHAKFKKQPQSTQPIQQEIKQPRTTPIPESQSF